MYIVSTGPLLNLHLSHFVTFPTAVTVSCDPFWKGQGNACSIYLIYKTYSF